MKICTKCKEKKDPSAFGKDRYRSDGLAAHCLICKQQAARRYAKANPAKIRESRRKYYSTHKGTIKAGKARCAAQQRRWRLAHKYRLTEAQFNALLVQQEHRCKICRSLFTETPCVDHDRSCCTSDRSCGTCIRGLLCRQCNKGLGSFNDDVSTLRNAIRYLENIDAADQTEV